MGTPGDVLEDTLCFLLFMTANHSLTQIFHSFEAWGHVGNILSIR